MRCAAWSTPVVRRPLPKQRLPPGHSSCGPPGSWESARVDHEPSVWVHRCLTELAVISAAAQLVERRGPLGTEQRRLLRLAHDSVAQLARLLREYQDHQEAEYRR